MNLYLEVCRSICISVSPSVHQSVGRLGGGRQGGYLQDAKRRTDKPGWAPARHKTDRRDQRNVHGAACMAGVSGGFSLHGWLAGVRGGWSRPDGPWEFNGRLQHGCPPSAVLHVGEALGGRFLLNGTDVDT